MYILYSIYLVWMTVLEVYNCIYCNCADCCLFSAKQSLLIEKFMYKNVFIKKKSIKIYRHTNWPLPTPILFYKKYEHIYICTLNTDIFYLKVLNWIRIIFFQFTVSFFIYIYIQLYILFDTQILISSSLVKIKIYCFETIFLLSSSTSLWLGVRDSAPSPGPSRGSRSAPCYTDPSTTTASVAGTLCP